MCATGRRWSERQSGLLARVRGAQNANASACSSCARQSDAPATPARIRVGARMRAAGPGPPHDVAAHLLRRKLQRAHTRKNAHLLPGVLPAHDNYVAALHPPAVPLAIAMAPPPQPLPLLVGPLPTAVPAADTSSGAVLSGDNADADPSSPFPASVPRATGVPEAPPGDVAGGADLPGVEMTSDQADGDEDSGPNMNARCPPLRKNACNSVRAHECNGPRKKEACHGCVRHVTGPM